MSNMEAKERMQVLLQQLKLTEDVYMAFFEQAELQRFTVNKTKRVWDFTKKRKIVLT